MAVRRWRAVIDFYADDTHEPANMAQWFRTVTQHQFPLGVIEGYPQVVVQDETTAALSRAQRAAAS